jgi:hypothetical protein
MNIVRPMNFARCVSSLFFVVALGLASGCGQKGSSGSGSGGHVHTAPHGGFLVEVGDHAYNVELVRDADAGKLTAYVLDGHAENFVRLALPSFDLVAITGGEKKSLTLRAVANAATGETVGNTSQFEAQADWLKKSGEFPGTITALEIKGTTFRDIAFYLKK